jgi:hypothetical protein
VGIAALGRVSANAVTAVSKDLAVNGFKVAGIIRVGFITEPGCLERAVVVVTLAGDPQRCTVQASPAASPLQMPCREVGAYVRRTLNPPAGAIIGLKYQGLSHAGSAALSDGLERHGFESGGTECWVGKRAVDR